MSPAIEELPSLSVNVSHLPVPSHTPTITILPLSTLPASPTTPATTSATARSTGHRSQPTSFSLACTRSILDPPSSIAFSLPLSAERGEGRGKQGERERGGEGERWREIGGDGFVKLERHREVDAKRGKCRRRWRSLPSLWERQCERRCHHCGRGWESQKRKDGRRGREIGSG